MTQVVEQKIDSDTSSQVEKVKVTFQISDTEEQVVYALPGLSVLEVAHQNGIDLEGACEGSLACATCHVIVDEEFYNKLQEISDAENDMLDLAFGLTHTSRLGCQIILTKKLDGIRLKIPAATRNI